MIPTEESRLAALRRLNLLDTARDERFDRIARLAQRIFYVPFACIALIDAERVWFKSISGADLREVPRAGSVFDRVAGIGAAVFAEDSAGDDRLAGCHDLKTLQLRFFAGVPLAAVDGSIVGIFAVGHRAPRMLSQPDQATLRDLARMVEEQIDASSLVDNFVKLLDAAEEQVLMRDRLVDMMGHELRTPLNGVLGFSQFLAQGGAGPLNGAQQACLKDLIDSANHLRLLVEDALDLTRAETGRIEYKPETVRLEALVAQVVSNTATLASEKHIEVKTETESDFPEAHLDPARFRQVVYNYLSNAIKYTPEGGKVAVRLSREGAGFCRIEVADTGIGIRSQDVDRIFTAFAQVRRRGGNLLGTGLGLVLTKHVVEAQGGRVGATSEHGQGSTFWAVLPLHAPEKTDA